MVTYTETTLIRIDFSVIMRTLPYLALNNVNNNNSPWEKKVAGDDFFVRKRADFGLKTDFTRLYYSKIADFNFEPSNFHGVVRMHHIFR